MRRPICSSQQRFEIVKQLFIQTNRIQYYGENAMADFALIASTLVYVCFTVSVYHSCGKMLPALLTGFALSVLAASFMHIGMYTSVTTLGSFFILGSILGPVLSLDDVITKNHFTKGNSVLVNRETLDSLPMTIRNTRPLGFRVIPQSQAA